MKAREFIEWVLKAETTKYDRRWRQGGRWRYYYRDKKHGDRHSKDSQIAHHHLTNHDHYKEGSAFSAGVKKGHWHIDKVDAKGKLHIRNDETGVSKVVTKKAFENRLVAAHKKQISNHIEHGLSRRLEIAKAIAEKHPTAPEAKRARSELKRWLGKTEGYQKTANGKQSDRISELRSQADLHLQKPMGKESEFSFEGRDADKETGKPPAPQESMTPSPEHKKIKAVYDGTLEAAVASGMLDTPDGQAIRKMLQRSYEDLKEKGVDVQPPPEPPKPDKPKAKISDSDKKQLKKMYHDALKTAILNDMLEGVGSDQAMFRLRQSYDKLKSYGVDVVAPPPSKADTQKQVASRG